MVVEKEVGESEANDMSAIRPGLSEMTSNATLPVNQAGNTFPQLVVAHYAGALVFSPCNRICSQINHTNSFVHW